VSGPLVAAVIVAGGAGERLGRPGGKQLAEVLGRPVLSWTLEAFEAAPEVELIVVVCHPERIDEYRRVAVNPVDPRTPVHFAPGGDSRQASVRNGLAALPASVRTVLVHDGARPLVTPELIASSLEALAAEPGTAGLVVGRPATDTIKRVEDHTVAETPDRSRYWTVQTPQVFAADVLMRAYEVAEADGFAGTDDASLVERLGEKVVVFEGPRDNIKVTVAEDLLLVEAALRFRVEEGGEER
jgi:2-C-methyl-D-erythritol 4-phosphate cytidylyltransferase